MLLECFPYDGKWLDGAKQNHKFSMLFFPVMIIDFYALQKNTENW